MTPAGVPTVFVIPRDAALRRETMRGAPAQHAIGTHGTLARVASSAL